jgi:hypothetical protein
MLKDPSYYSFHKRSSLSKDVLSLEEKFRILDAMYEEARQFGHFGKHDLLLGLEATIRLAAALTANVSIPPR